MRIPISLLVLVLAVPAACAADAVPSALPTEVTAVLARHCLECHGKEAHEADVRLDALASLDQDARLALLNKVQDQLFFGTMPPADKTRPSASDRDLLAGWVRGELRRHDASELDKKLKYPDYGNYVEHEALFGGRIAEAPYTPARRWRISPQIFHERVLDVFRLTGRDRDTYRSRSFYGVTNPFVLPEQSGVRDYDVSTLDGGHLLVMLGNAQWISEKQIFAARHAKSDRRKLQFPNPADRWYPPTAPEAFETIVLKEGQPTEAELVAAIRAQFDCVLRRAPTDDELAKYLSLTRAAVDLGGNVEGLRQMLVAVLLESEFLYRLEFGAGAPDEHGRLGLSPREASYAISYALGDRAPDPGLVAAAAEGRLLTREDYRREVQRLLDEPDWYKGEVDPTLDGMHFRSNETSHPRLVRFFRDFFGYANALKVFKDIKRSDGFYRNPDRGSTHTPGRLVLEADMLVDWCLRRDRNVFETLLTGDRFFVAPVADAQKKIDVLNMVYERFKDTDWRKNPRQVVDEHREFVGRHVQYRAGEKQLVQVMTHLTYFRERGLEPHPDWSYPFGIHMLTPWARSYDIDPATVQYVPEQPFPVAHRKGLLTHPAWLVAHSSNFHTDPIRRGRWIREKLLAGRVPDVPITVDAQVPEDPHRTFRQRVEQVTAAESCRKCHAHMNPLGMPFEIYDDFGRHRTVESLEHPDNFVRAGTGKYDADVYRTAPVDATGELTGTGDPGLDGKVVDALDLVDRLARSERVRQSIVRHAFRFFLGRNEMLSDSRTLIDADRAYVESGGSFRAVVVSLLTSDSFLYRKPAEDHR